MTLNLEELDDATRQHMLANFELEEASDNPYRGMNLSPIGRRSWVSLMRTAIENGDDVSLCASLQDAALWNDSEPYVRDGISRQRAINICQASERLATSEFNTWYVRGLSAKLLAEGVEECEVYRAAEPKYQVADCSTHEGSIVPVQLVYQGHRQRYWPEPGNEAAYSIPFQPGCHHSIRRVRFD